MMVFHATTDLTAIVHGIYVVAIYIYIIYDKHPGPTFFLEQNTICVAIIFNLCKGSVRIYIAQLLRFVLRRATAGRTLLTVYLN